MRTTDRGAAGRPGLFRRRGFGRPFPLGLLAVVAFASAALAAPNQVFVDRGVLEYDEKNFPAALENFAKAVELDPRDPRARYFLGITLIALDRFDDAVTHLREGRAQAPEDLDMAFALGLALFSKGDFDGALPHFQEVAAREPAREDLGYYLGRIHYQRKDYERALAALEAGRSTDPDITQLTRFYAGLAKHQLGRDVEAARELEAAAAIRPASPIAITARRFEEVVTAARPEARRFRAEARVGYQYDDNVRVAPTKNVIGLGDQERRSTGELFLVRGELDFLRAGALQASASYSFVAILNDVVDGFDVKDHRPGLDGVYRASLGGIPLVAGARYTYDAVFLDDDRQVVRQIVQPYAIAAWAPWTDTSLFYRFTDNDSKVDPARGLRKERLDSTNHQAGFYQTFFFPLLGGRHALRAGYAYDAERAEGADYTYTGHKALAGLALQLPYGFDFTADFEYHARDYPTENALALDFNGNNESGAPFRTKREDWENTLLLALSRELVASRAFGSLGLSLEYFRDRNVSTFSVFDYVRNVVSLNAIWRY